MNILGGNVGDALRWIILRRGFDIDARRLSVVPKSTQYAVNYRNAIGVLYFKQIFEVALVDVSPSDGLLKIA